MKHQPHYLTKLNQNIYKSIVAIYSITTSVTFIFHMFRHFFMLNAIFMSTMTSRGLKHGVTPSPSSPSHIAL